MTMLQSLGVPMNTIVAQMESGKIAAARPNASNRRASSPEAAASWGARSASTLDRFNKVWFLRAGVDRAHVLRSLLATGEGVTNFARFLYLQSLTSEFTIPEGVRSLLAAEGQDEQQILNKFEEAAAIFT